VLRRALAGAATVVRKAASDMWAMGVIMYEMYSGHRLFEDMTDDEVKIAVCSVRARLALPPPPHLTARCPALPGRGV